MIVVVSEIIDGHPGRTALIEVPYQAALALRCAMLGLKPPVMAAVVPVEALVDFPPDGIGRILTREEMREFLVKQEMLTEQERPS